MDTSGGEKKSILMDQRGMALLITVMTVSLLVAVTTIFHRKTWHSYIVANNYKINTQLKAIGESGINIGLAILLQDAKKNNFDSFLDNWATFKENELEALFASGQLELEVIDLSGRLQINRLVQKKAGKQGEEQEKDQKTGQDNDQGKDGNKNNSNSETEIRDILLRLLLSPAFAIEEESEARGIVDALVDWIDEDERETDNGAESSYYQALANPYECRNGPVRYIKELLLVKGISPQLLFGKGERKGLADYLTVYGEDGRININTADIELVKSLNPLIGDELAEELHAFRIDKENEGKLENPAWYTTLGSWPGDIVLNDELLTTRSSFFLIRSTGTSDSLFRQVTAVVNRVNKETVKVLSRKVD